ncbi:MAG: hypothetical protein U5K70_07790 [Halodesulfurarchaeum sp.]|nr:hypothetical protein [Halodesulfurarchaeum sp.]
MAKYPSGTVAWAVDPTGAHETRPVIVLAHENRPYNSVECTIMSLGTEPDKYDHYTPQLEESHLTGINFGKPTVLLPWSLYTIPPSTIEAGRAHGTLTAEGEKLVKKGLLSLFTGP